LHHAAQKVALVRKEQVKNSLISDEKAFLSQAGLKKSFRPTLNERKQMSTKTSIKRIALVAVSALGFGLLSVVPAKAAESAVAEVAGFSATQNGNRSGISSALYVKAVANSTSDDTDEVTLNAALVARPAGSALTLNGNIDAANANAAPDVFTPSAANVDFVGNGASALSTTVELLWTPDVAGTYRVAVWHDENADDARDAGEKTTQFTIVVVADDAPITATVTALNTTSTDLGAYGAAVKVEIKNSLGVPTRLGGFEQFALAVTGDAEIDASEDNDGTATPQDANYLDVTSLVQANFAKGVAYLNIHNATAETVVFTISGETGAANAAVKKTLSLVYTDAISIDTDTALDVVNDGTGASDNGGGQVAIKKSTSSTVDFAETMDTADVDYVADSKYNVSVVDTDGYWLGVAGWGYDRSVTAVGAKVSFSVSLALPEGITADVTVTSDDNNSYEIIGEAAAADALVTTNATTSYRLLDGGSLTLTLKMTDQFGNALANETVAVSVAGRNSKSATLVTDASGLISYTLTDTVGATGLVASDTVTFDGNADEDVSITYVSSYGVSTVTLSYPGEDDTVAGTTSTDISAAAGGATGSSASIVATVKDENGSILSGVPVTFAVAGLTGAEVHTNLATVITNGEGKATGKVSSYAAGKATVTVTAAGKSATADIYFKQQDADDARTITATASNGIVTATVKDRYGNPIKDVTVKATRSGTGFFGSGSSSAEGSTDKNGVVDFYFNGTGTVTVGFDGDEYGQSADAAGKVGTTAVTASAAGTALVAQKGLGASLAPAGVNSVTLSVEGTSAATEAATAAADAAAEAIDAANAATDAANLAAEAADAATVAAEEARDAADAATAAVEELATQVATLMAALKAQITPLANTVAKIAKKGKA
jgi:hypothetical protein